MIEPRPARSWRVFHGYHRRLVLVSLALAVLGGLVPPGLHYSLPFMSLPFMADNPPAAPSVALPMPSPAEWRGTPLTPGTEAPAFDLMDARTGRRVRLEDYRGERPVVLLLSSFG
jgi:hypothetical protein